MRDGADFELRAAGGEGAGHALALTGSLRVHAIGELDRRLEEAAPQFDRLDISAVEDIDTSGAWLVMRLAEQNHAEITGASERAARLIQALADIRETEAEPPAPDPLWHRTLNEFGMIVIGWDRGAVTTLSFMGALILSFGTLFRHPGRFRGKALVHQMQLVGVNALFIIGLMSFLVGIVIAQQGAVQLRQFGAEIYTVNLTGRLAFRELGVLMTAIMVAGRSGSAFAAQIGTMKLTEEIDAMRTIGVSPMEALVVPRVLAAMFMMVVLGFYASIMAIIGGAFISSFTLGIPFFNFLSRIQDVVPLHDLWVGMTKAPVFGLIIAIAGCHQGMEVRSNAEEVGQRTTQAVVTAIFAVIVLDAFFAVFFTEVGWT
ncbi:MAG: MlaE family lipid ABC transporter permease subunit [Alphaproteobacteria bacterium]|nr:MlaE family lipid ABC transporter permease subunit [Alphaproteobacteria bacterium]